jgi:hypothetical protein
MPDVFVGRVHFAPLNALLVLCGSVFNAPDVSAAQPLRR